MLDLRKTPRIRTSHVVAGAALVLITTGGATAAGLVTGKDIKNGSVTTQDIKNGSLVLKDFKATERSKLVGANGVNGANGSNGANGAQGTQGTQGTQGVQGVQGVQGTAGASAFAPPPSGTSISGGGMITGTVSAAAIPLRTYSPLPFTPAGPFVESGATSSNLFFGGAHVATAPADRNASCTGSAAAPTAPAGQMCVYIAGSPENIAASSANVAGGTLGGADGADRNGFFIFADSAAAGVMVLRYVWAYTAP